MALQVCKKCTTAYAPGPECPNCGANEWLGELEAEEAGLEFKSDQDAEESATEPAAADPSAGTAEGGASEGGSAPSHDDGDEDEAVRGWARAQGIAIPDGESTPSWVTQAYREETRP